MYTLYRHFFRAPPEVWGPGADSIQIGSAPAPGKKSNSRRLRLLTLKLVILARKLIINTILFYITFISINCSEFMFNTRTRLIFLKFFLPKRCSQSRKGGSGSRALTDQKIGFGAAHKKAAPQHCFVPVVIQSILVGLPWLLWGRPFRSQKSAKQSWTDYKL